MLENMPDSVLEQMDWRSLSRMLAVSKEFAQKKDVVEQIAEERIRRMHGGDDMLITRWR
jgi:hypothetical protein